MLVRLATVTLVCALTFVACTPQVTPTPPDAATGGSSGSGSGGSECGEFDTSCDTQPTPPDQPPNAPPDQPPPGTVEVPLFFIGDCVTAACPAATPYPVACEVLFSPGDDRGCVASTPTSSVVYFQAGDECDEGIVGGRLFCSATPGAPLDATTCSINKPVPIYAGTPSGCPDIKD